MGKHVKNGRALLQAEQVLAEQIGHLSTKSHSGPLLEDDLKRLNLMVQTYAILVAIPGKGKRGERQDTLENMSDEDLLEHAQDSAENSPSSALASRED